ncbi:MAG: hypothetical protein QXU98_11780 [Candidatus Parvarchaeota archaeon]
MKELTKQFIYTYSILWLFLVLYTVTDIIVWPTYQHAGVSVILYDKLWFFQMLGYIVISAILLRSLAVPYLIFLYNYDSVESFFYYTFQGKMLPSYLPWLNFPHATQIYANTIIFIFFSALFVFIEIFLKGALRPKINEMMRKIRSGIFEHSDARGGKE